MSQQKPPPRRDRSRETAEVSWVCVATAPDQLVAEMWQELMREESIPSMLAPQDTISFLGVASTPVRLMVPLPLKSRAEEVLAGITGESPTCDADGANG